MNERNQPSIKEPETKQKKRNIQKDIVNLAVDKEVRMVKSISVATVPLAVVMSDLILVYDLHNNDFALPASAFITSNMINVCNNVYKAYKENRQFNNKLSKEEKLIDTNTDPFLAYRAAELVYDGRNSLQIDGKTKMKKGDCFQYVTLPSIPIQQMDKMESSNDFIQLRKDLDRVVVKDLLEKTEGKGDQLIIIDVRRDNSPDLFKDVTEEDERMIRTEKATNVYVKELFTEKGVVLNEQDKSVQVFRREQLEELLKTSSHMFEKATEALEDNELNQLIEVAIKAQNSNEWGKAKDLVSKHIQRILRKELEINFNGPELKSARTATGNLKRRKAYRTLSLTKLKNMSLVMQTVSETGEITRTPVEKLLKTNDKPLEKILTDKSPHHKAQIACFLYSMIHKMTLEDLTKKEVISVEEVVKKIKDAGIEIKPAESITTLIDEKRTMRKQFKNVRNFLAPFILSAFITTAATAGSKAIEIPDITDHIPGINHLPGREITAGNDNKNHRTGFFSSAPIHSLDWKITADKDARTEGYYTTDTSHQFENGTWKQNREREKELEKIPVDTIVPNYGQTALSLQKLITLTETETSIKIPIKDHSRFLTAEVSGKGLSDNDYKIYKLTDGTIELVINKEHSKDNIVLINAILESDPDLKDPVHATDSIVPVDESQIEGPAQEQIQKSRALAVQGHQYPIALEGQIQDSHAYSIDPPDRKMVEEANTPEQMINAVGHISGCSCEICNTALVLESTLNSQTSSNDTMNLAFGYMNQIPSNPGSTPEIGANYLLSETSHAYGINPSGLIFDATPSVTAGDKLTQKYLNLLDNEAAYQQGEDRLWDAQNERVTKEQTLKEDLLSTLKITGTLAAIGATAALGGRMKKLIETTFTGENKRKAKARAQAAIDSSVLAAFSPKDLREANSFLSWISWGGDKTLMKLPVESQDKQEMLNQIRSTRNEEKIKQYLANPTKFEKQSGLSTMNVRKLRLFTHYILK